MWVPALRGLRFKQHNHIASAELQRHVLPMKKPIHPRDQDFFDLAPELQAAMMEQAAKNERDYGIPADLRDRAPWLPDDPSLDPWWKALQAADAGDPDPLEELLKLEEPVPEAVRPHLIDLAERKVLKSKPGRPRTPSYDRSPDGGMQWLAVHLVGKMEEEGVSRDDAIEAVSSQLRLSWNAVDNYVRK